MIQYHKIQTVFNRDPKTNHKTLIDGDYSLPEFEYLKGNKWVFTEKVDGTNIRIKCQPYQEDGKAYGITFGGKSDNAQIPATLVVALEAKFHSTPTRKIIAEILPEGACLYGEGYGAKIQKGGGNYRQDQGFVLFDVKCGDYWLQRVDIEDVASKLGISFVPIIGEGTLDDMVSMAKRGIKSTWGDFQAEGIVARPATELRTRSNHRVITKIKSRDYKS